MTGRAVRHVPNAISVTRLMSVPVLAWLVWEQRQPPFTWLLLAALLSDGVDGYIARRFGCITRLGALLDSVADAALMVVIGYGTWVFYPQVFEDHGLIVAVTVGLWILEHVAALIRYHRPSSFHTHLVRIGVLIFGVFVAVMFVFDFYPWLLYVAAVISIVAVLEQLAMICLLAEWTPDVRGGLAEVLRRRAGRQG
jgi:CDP-diacylglycerol--glycerol-3-phosphate 3-phosphatidyltransferase